MENSYGIQVLVIEDDLYFSQVLKDILEIKGCIATCVTNADAGLRLLSEIQPHIVFCDINLPGEMSGWDFARCIRAMPSFADVALVAISGAAPYVDGTARSAFDMTLRKPVKFAELSNAIDAYAGAGKRTHTRPISPSKAD